MPSRTSGELVKPMAPGQAQRNVWMPGSSTPVEKRKYNQFTENPPVNASSWGAACRQKTTAQPTNHHHGQVAGNTAYLECSPEPGKGGYSKVWWCRLPVQTVG